MPRQGKTRSLPDVAATRGAPGARRYVGAMPRWLLAADWAWLLIVAVLLAYTPVYRAGYIWDDDQYIERNHALRDLEGLRLMWTRPGEIPQYYPVVHTMFWVEYHLWGLNPAGFHAVNVVLHAINALLLWRLLVVLRVPGAWLAAGVFALHPVHVESVAWISERKNTLSAFFYLLSVLAYLRFRPLEDRPGGRWYWYGLALAAFTAAILSKTVTISFIPAMLVLTWWKRGRLGWRDVWPLMAFVAVAALISPVSIAMEHGFVADERYSPEDWHFSWVQRVLIAGRAVWFYAGKLVWPAELVFCYDRWQIDPAVVWQWLFPLGAVAVLVSAAMLRRRLGRGPLAALLLFGGTLFPALGFTNYYPMRYTFVADHFQYLASIPMLALLCAAVVLAGERLAQAAGARVVWPESAARGESARRRNDQGKTGARDADARRANPAATARQAAMHKLWPAGVVLTGALLLTLGGLTWRQSRIYESRETLWRDTITKRPNCFMAYNNLGCELRRQGRYEEGIGFIEQALRIRPGSREILGSLASAYAAAGRYGDALKLQLGWLKEHPDDADMHHNAAVTYLQGFDEPQRAMVHVRRALELRPGWVLAEQFRGVVEARLRREAPAASTPATRPGR